MEQRSEESSVSGPSKGRGGVGRGVLLGLIALCVWADGEAVRAELNLKVLVIPIRHQNPPCPTDPGCEWIQAGPPGTPRNSASEWEAILNNDVNAYYLRASYSQTSFSFLVAKDATSSDGWFTAPHNIEEYIAEGNDFFAQDAMALAGKVVDLSQYPRVVILHNFQRRGGQIVTISYDGDDHQGIFILEHSINHAMVALLCHELGHTLGLPDLYGYGAPGVYADCHRRPECLSSGAMGPWDIMSDDPYFNHPCAWTKEKAGWLAGVPSHVVTLQPLGTSATSVTVALDETGISGKNLLKIPLVYGSTFYGYYVECRRQRYGDENIPEEGVLVSMVDDGPAPGGICNRPVQVVKTEPPYDLCSAALQAGEAIVFDHYTLSIQHLGYDEGRCLVAVEYTAGNLYPDLAIAGKSAYESDLASVDVWVDSPMNGHGVYPAEQPLDSDGVPLGPGDPVWKDHENRICFRVRNVGFATAEDIVVEVGVAQPPEMLTICGPAAAPSVSVGTREFNSLPSQGTLIGWVPWSPTSAGPARIDVDVLPVDSEIHTSNNFAQESVAFYSPVLAQPGSTLEPFATSLRVSNSGCPRPVEIRAAHKFLHPEAPLTEGWGVMIDPATFSLQPGGQTTVRLGLAPPRSAQPGDMVDVQFSFVQSFASMMDGQGGSAPEPIGGLRVHGSVVAPSSLTCVCPRGEIPAGSPVTVSGLLNPPRADAPVALEYTTPGSRTVLRTVRTDSAGSFTDRPIATLEGSWSVAAYWQGNEETQGTESAPCSFLVLPSLAPLRVPGDCTADGDLDISDAICIFGVLFLSIPARFPCGDGLPGDEGNRNLLDWQPDGDVDISDGVSVLQFLFLDGPAHHLSIFGGRRDCVPILGCKGSVGCEGD